MIRLHAVTASAVARARLLLVSAGVLGLAACSSGTDVVGVLDPSVTDPDLSVTEIPSEEATGEGVSGEPAGGTAADADEALLVAGLALPDWSGPTSPWPLDTRLSNFFSQSGWGSGPGGYSGPGRAERAAFELRGGFSGEELRQVRYAAPTGLVAESLRDWFEGVPPGPGPREAGRSQVARDSWGEQYLVALDERCDRSGRRDGDCMGLNGFESARK